MVKSPYSLTLRSCEHSNDSPISLNVQFLVCIEMLQIVIPFFSIFALIEHGHVSAASDLKNNCCFYIRFSIIYRYTTLKFRDFQIVTYL